MHEMCCTRLAGNTGRKNDAKNRQLRTIAQLCPAISSQLRHVSAIVPLTAEMVGIWGTPANFSGFRVLATLLQRRHSPEANQTLHYVWPSPGLIRYIYIVGGLLSPDGILPDAKFTLRPSLAFSYIGSVTARHSSSGR